MNRFTVKDFPHLDLGDIRRNERFVSIINNMTVLPGVSIPRQNGDWYSTKATYEFYKNNDITVEQLAKTISCYGTQQVCGHQQVLIAHDFCQISYTESKAQGLGYLAHCSGRGVITYNSIAISNNGIPLSLIYQQSFLRAIEDFGKAKKRKQLKYEDKESYYWYKGITAVNQQLGNDVHKIHIADREADIYELFFCSYEKNTDLLIRAQHNRKLTDKSALWDAIAARPLAAKVSLEIPDKTGKSVNL